MNEKSKPQCDETLKGEGTQVPGLKFGDVIIKVVTDPDARFRRTENDLYYRHSITLLEALVGFRHTLVNLNEATLIIERNAVTSPDTVIQLIGQGMPVMGTWNSYGDLFILFEIRFPKIISHANKQVIRRLLGEPVCESESHCNKKEEL